MGGFLRGRPTWSPSRAPDRGGLGVVGDIVLKLGFAVAGSYLVLAIADVLYERCQHEDLRMTKHEVKQEAKDRTSRRRSRAR